MTSPEWESALTLFVSFPKHLKLGGAIQTFENISKSVRSPFPVWETPVNNPRLAVPKQSPVNEQMPSGRCHPGRMDRATQGNDTTSEILHDQRLRRVKLASDGDKKPVVITKSKLQVEPNWKLNVGLLNHMKLLLTDDTQWNYFLDLQVECPC